LTFPTILIETAANLERFISSEILNEMTTSESLIEEITKRLTPY
jgi:hypothetical protein